MSLIEIVVRLAWLIGAAGFVIGLMRMNSPATARNGNLLSAAGMALAIAGTAVWLAVGVVDPESPRTGIGMAGWIIIAAGIAVKAAKFATSDPRAPNVPRSRIA